MAQPQASPISHRVSIPASEAAQGSTCDPDPSVGQPEPSHTAESPPSPAGPSLTMGMLQDPVDEHWVLGDALRHQQDALLYPMPLQHSRAGHFL